jgi:hypothetical protein
MLYQAAEFGKYFADLKNLFTRGSGSVYERLFKLYVASRHMDQMFLKRHVRPDATTTVWITNDGLACADASVTFAVLREELIGHRKIARYFAEELPKQVQEKAKGSKLPP